MKTRHPSTVTAALVLVARGMTADTAVETVIRQMLRKRHAIDDRRRAAIALSQKITLLRAASILERERLEVRANFFSVVDTVEALAGSAVPDTAGA